MYDLWTRVVNTDRHCRYTKNFNWTHLVDSLFILLYVFSVNARFTKHIMLVWFALQIKHAAHKRKSSLVFVYIGNIVWTMDGQQHYWQRNAFPDGFL